VDRSDKVFVLLLLVGLAAAIMLAVGRAGVEARSPTVEIIVDADDVRQLTAAAGVRYEELLTQLRQAGAGALAVREVTLGGLVESGRVLTRGLPAQTAIYTPEPGVASALAAALRARLPGIRVDAGLLPDTVIVHLDSDQLAEIPLMLRPEDVRAADAAGLRVVARLLNFPTATPSAIASAVARAAEAGARLVVFDKEEVLGYDGLLDETAGAIRRCRLIVGRVEMAGQRGDRELARRLPSRTVRLHSISDADMLAMVPQVAIPRYARAVRERGIRACYVRLMLRPQRDPLEANLSYLRGVARAVQDEGYRIGPCAPLTAPEGYAPKWLRGLVLVALPAAFVLLLRCLLPLTASWAWAVLAATAIAGLALARLHSPTAAVVGGLGAACIFPALGTLTALQSASRPGQSLGLGRIVGASLARLGWAALVSAVGGILIVGLLSPVSYLAGVQQFRGVKVAYLVPLILIVVAVAADLRGGREPLPRWWTRARLRAGQLLTSPVTVIQALVILFALGAIVVALMRSGNQPLAAPSGAEMKLRDLLESLLVARPRTKEFLIGHPAFMLAIAVALRGRRNWLPLLALLGGIGQVSLLNSFCHLHMPLGVTLLRSFNGLWLGALLGVVALLLWRRLFHRRPRATSS
jgi:hypothetical protein